VLFTGLFITLEFFGVNRYSNITLTWRRHHWLST
jgi:hypothetical protein